MKNKILGVLLAIPLLGVALNSYATTTVLAIPSITDGIGTMLDTAGALLTGFWGIIWVLVGIAIFGWVVSRLTNRH